MSRKHDPSEYRSIARASKNAKSNHEELMNRAMEIQDPYYESLALMTVCLHKRIDAKNAKECSGKALELAYHERRDWRRAELLGELCKLARKYHHDGQHLKAAVLVHIKSMPNGKDKTDAISGCVDFLGPENAAPLLKMALANEDFEFAACKPVIRLFASKIAQGRTSPEIPDILSILTLPENAELQSKVLGYLHLQLSKNNIPNPSIFSQALDRAATLPCEKQIRALKYLIHQSLALDELEQIALRATEMSSPVDEARAFTSLAGKADKLGHRKTATDWLTTARDIIMTVPEGDSARTLMNIALGFEKLGDTEKSREILELASDDAGDDTGLKRQILARLDKDDWPPRTQQSRHRHPIEAEPSSGHVLALYDTHEGGLAPVHVRMIARAAPLCVAYGLDLAILGFPDNDIDAVVEQAAIDTNIGKGGKYLRDLANQNRISSVTFSAGKAPEKAAWDRLGMPVATTSRPFKGKKSSLPVLAAEARQKHPSGRLCVIMGLGKKGLPKSLLESVEHHVELTGRKIPLETSTAMGIIAMKLGMLE